MTSELDIIVVDSDDVTVVSTGASLDSISVTQNTEIPVLQIEAVERGPTGDPGPKGDTSQQQVFFGATEPDFGILPGFWVQDLGSGNMTLWFEDGQ